MIQGSEKNIFLNLVLDYIPETMQKLICYYTKMENGFPSILMKIFTYQLFRSLSYLHAMDICHRNLKPTNILINPITYSLKICDFGSAKKLIQGDNFKIHKFKFLVKKVKKIWAKFVQDFIAPLK